ncbi:MAG TPA: M15 family metallopeptidase [Mycobacteriales bacterium]|jgi:D-alanyl-D-alanine dipeptidase|nr:M15 family metallopeptidase [Mycobacteriales bacterium]
MLLLSDPRVGAVPVQDNGEPLVDLRPDLRVDARRASTSGAFAYVRRGLRDRLIRAQSALPAGAYLLVVEGWRPMPVQVEYFRDYEAKVRAAMPDVPPEEVRVAASAYVSPPEVAPHPTGGAVDLTLCDGDGIELDMGTALNATPLASDNACYTAASGLEPQAQRNRSLLVATLLRAGLVNYPTEWWHWSYGERYWALATGAPMACYAERAGP